MIIGLSILAVVVFLSACVIFACARLIRNLWEERCEKEMRDGK